MDKPPAINTIARVPGGWAVAASSSSWCVVYETADGSMIISRRGSSGANELLPRDWGQNRRWSTFAVSPSGDALYIGTSDARIVMCRAPWSNAEEVTLLSGQDVLRVSQLRTCEEG
jgi:hypothetical protein